jgi:cobalamin biosynthesis Co2+ chelatase CbiK
MDTRTRVSCREVFKVMKILPMYSQYIYSFILYTVSNKHLYNTNNEIHKYRTRDNNNLHLPIVSLSEFNERAYFSVVKVSNHILEYIKNLSHARNVLCLP